MSPEASGYFSSYCQSRAACQFNTRQARPSFFLTYAREKGARLPGQHKPGQSANLYFPSGNTQHASSQSRRQPAAMFRRNHASAAAQAARAGGQAMRLSRSRLMSTSGFIKVQQQQQQQLSSSAPGGRGAPSYLPGTPLSCSPVGAGAVPTSLTAGPGARLFSTAATEASASYSTIDSAATPLSTRSAQAPPPLRPASLSTFSSRRRPLAASSALPLLFPGQRDTRPFSTTPAAMVATKLDGTAIAKSIRERIGREIAERQKLNPRYRPSLKIVQGTRNHP